MGLKLPQAPLTCYFADDMEPQSTDIVALLVVAGGLLVSGAGAFFFAKRARQRRREQIEASEPKSVQKRKPALGELIDEEIEEPDAGEPVGEIEAEAPVVPEQAKAAPVESSPTLGQPQDKPRQPETEKRGKPDTASDTAALKQGLARTRSSWVAKLGQIFSGKKELNQQVVDDLERVLLTADIGVKTANSLLEDIKSSLSRKELTDTDAVWTRLKQRSVEILTVEAAPLDFHRAKPFVLLVIGVNGTGKTTTIGKLAAKLTGEGRKVLLAAGDTFRAAAVEQLEVWAGRAGCPIVKGKEGSDPSAVLFEAVKKAQTENFDIIIADTAGRLHTKTDLMAELSKVGRVLNKAMEGCPHETWLVLDSTSGQNAIQQAQIFTQAMKVSGIVLTKLDGTAKGGVILGITDELKLPIRYIGVGERVEDLRAFDVQEFVDALYDREDIATLPFQ